MKRKIKGLRSASGATENKTPFTFTVWYDKERNRVFTINDSFDQWVRDYELLGYIKLLEGGRHFTMKEIIRRIDEYWSMVVTWEKGLS